MGNKTFLQGVSDIAKVATGDQNADNMLRNFTLAWVPNLLKERARSVEEMIPEGGNWGKGKQRATNFMRRLFQQGRIDAITFGAAGAVVEGLGGDVEVSTVEKITDNLFPVFRSGPTEIETAPTLKDILLTKYSPIVTRLSFLITI